MLLRSSAFEDTQTIPPTYAKGGENVSPPLSWENAPQETKSFALAVVDRHPVARNFVHWIVVDIGAAVTSLAEGASSSGLMSEGTRQIKVYVGPNPPSGSHDYEFTLYALKIDKLKLPAKVSLETFTGVVEQSSLAAAKLVGKLLKLRQSSTADFATFDRRDFPTQS